MCYSRTAELKHVRPRRVSMASSRSFQVLTTFCDGVNCTKVEKYRIEQSVQKKLLARQIPWVFVFVNGEEDEGNV
jgi:hypothetical protein